MPKRTVKALSTAFKGLSETGRLKAEIELLTRCSSDTAYRLRYDTMEYDYVSPAVERLLGYSVREIRRLNLRSLILQTRIVSDGMRAVESYAGLEETRRRGEVRKWQADYLMKTKDGRTIWVSDVSYPWFDERGAIIGSIGSLRDISERIAAEERLREEMLHLEKADSLTGLATRQTFWSRLDEETRRLNRTKGDLSLLLLSVDRFDTVREAYGREIADTVLGAIAKLLQGSVREIDLAARLADEEFGLILPETGRDGAVQAARRLQDIVTRETFFAGSRSKPVGCTISVGAASTHFGEKCDASGLYKLADTRLFVARQTGQNAISAGETGKNLH